MAPPPSGAPVARGELDRLRWRALADVLIYGDTVRSPELRHEVPLSVPDPFLYAERDGARHVFVSSLEASRVRETGVAEVHPYEEIGYDE